MRSTWARINSAAPTNASETATETIKATVIVKLRRSPLATSLRTKENLIMPDLIVHTFRALGREQFSHLPFAQSACAFDRQSQRHG